MWTRSVLPALALTICVALAGCDLFVSADERVARAEERIAAHDYRAAMIELKNALQSQKDHVRARFLLAKVSLQLGDIAAADNDLRLAVAGGMAVEQTAPLAAEIRLASGRASELLSMIDAGELPLSEPQRSIYRGKALLDLQQPGPAFDSLSAVLTTHPESNEVRVGIAEALVALGRIDEALRELEKIPAAAPEATAASLARGGIYARRGQFEDAERTLQSARKSAAARLSLREQIAMLAVLAETQLSRGDVAAARGTHAELARISPDAPLTALLAARISMAAQNYPEAVSELQRVVSSAPGFVPARFLLGAALLGQGSLNQAELHLAQVVQQAPENMEARKLLAQVQLRLQRPEAALDVLLPATRAETADGQIEALMGFAHLQAGDESRGIGFLERSVAESPNNRNLRLDLATAYYRTGANDKAVELLRSLDHSVSDTRREQLLIAVVGAQSGQKAAVGEIESLLQRFPNEVGLLNLAGTYFAQQGQVERARVLLGRASQIQPNDVLTLINRARVEAVAGNPAAGTGLLEKALAADPANVSAHLALAELALRRNDHGDAVKWLQQARQQKADAIEPRLQLARIHLRERRNTQADDVLKEVLTVAPGRAEVVNAVGAINMEAGRYEEALARFRAATDLASDNPLYWLNVAQAQLALGHGSVAREALHKAAAARRNWLPAIGALALLDVKEGKSAEALQRVAAVKQALPGDASVLVLEGDLHMALKRYPDAAAAYERAANSRPTAALALKSYHARQQGRLGDAVVPLEAWIKREPQDFAVRAVLADAYQAAGQRERAVEQYELIVRNQPDVTALNNLAWLYHETGDQRAEATAQRAYAAAPHIPAVADTYGWILVRGGKAAEGLPVLKEAAAAAKGQPEIDYHYAAALAATGATVEARKLLDAVLRHPEPFAGRPDAQRLLDRLSGS